MILLDKWDPAKSIEDTPSMIYVVGGDGSLLRAVRLYADKKVPFFGVAAGTVNFLMNKENTISLTHSIIPLTRIKVTAISEGIEYIAYAFNEVAIGSFCGWNHYILDDITDCMGACISICTPQGSTGLNKSSGGNILELDSKKWYLVGTQLNTTLSKELDTTTITGTIESREPVILKVDGIDLLKARDFTIKIEKADTVNLIINSIDEFKEKRKRK